MINSYLKHLKKRDQLIEFVGLIEKYPGRTIQELIQKSKGISSAAMYRVTSDAVNHKFARVIKNHNHHKRGRPSNFVYYPLVTIEVIKI